MLQAVAEGDASKIAKGRGKGGGGGKSKEEAALDAYFLVDEEDDGDYQPGQDDSGAACGGGDGGGDGGVIVVVIMVVVICVGFSPAKTARVRAGARRRQRCRKEGGGPWDWALAPCRRGRPSAELVALPRGLSGITCTAGATLLAHVSETGHGAMNQFMVRSGRPAGGRRAGWKGWVAWRGGAVHVPHPPTAPLMWWQLPGLPA
jgi:hypothetical protein